MSRDRIGVVLISAMAASTLLGSISGLIHYAEKGTPGVLTWGTVNIPVGSIAFVAGLDGLAISLTVLAHRKGSTDWAAFTGLALATAASTALQVAAVWGDATAVIVHGTPAPCTAVAAFFLLNSLGHGTPEESLPPPPVHAPGGLTAEASASGPAAEAMAAPPSAPEVPSVAPDLQPRRPTPSAQRGTRSADGRSGRGRATAPAQGVQGDELVRRTARWLMENDRKLSARGVEAAVKAINGTCSRATRDEVYAALRIDEAMTEGPETSDTPAPKEG